MAGFSGRFVTLAAERLTGESQFFIVNLFRRDQCVSACIQETRATRRVINQYTWMGGGVEKMLVLRQKKGQFLRDIDLREDEEIRRKVTIQRLRRQLADQRPNFLGKLLVSITKLLGCQVRRNERSHT